MIRRPPSATRTDTLLPYPALCRCEAPARRRAGSRPVGVGVGDDHDVPPRADGRAASTLSQRVRREQTGMDSKGRSEEHTSELQSLMRISYAVFCLKKKTKTIIRCLYAYQQDNVRHQPIHTQV